ncbi:MAG: S41 family peptidase [Bacteroidales bacterium]
MNRRKLRKILIWVPISIILFTLVAFKSVDFKTSKSLDIFFSFFRELSIFYVDETDSEELIHVGIEAILESLDPYNEFIPEEGADALEFQTTGEYGGMGALIRHSENFPIIAEVYEGSPAHKAGIMAGDIIQEINGESVEGMMVDKVSNKLKGAPKTNLTVVVKRFGHAEPITFKFEREKIHIPSVPYHAIINENTGYIRLANFTANCNKEVEAALKDVKAQKAQNLILDLRSNPGGLLNEAVKIVNLFVDKDELVVYTQGQISQFDQEYKTQSKPVDTETPLIVLVDRISASASEIVAGALQDLDRAIIIGERTFGKGLVQATRPLPYNTQLKVTTAKYYIPSGRCIQAVDFTKRNDDGSIRYIPDSLISEFTTRNGRKVFDGGGIAPDIEHQVSPYSRIASVLYAQNIFFNYATQFRARNKDIETPGSFGFTKQQYENFITFLDTCEFEYQSQTEQALNSLIEASKEENYYSIAQPTIDSLEAIVVKNRYKDLHHFESEIKRLLEEEIIGRYYLQKGEAEYSINNDDVINVCKDLFNDENRFREILSKGTFDSEPKKEVKETASIQSSESRHKNTQKLALREGGSLLPS